MYAICRLQVSRCNAWLWRVSFRRRGKLYSKSFNDGVYGGSKHAQAAAIKWRDDQLQRLGILSIVEFHKQKRSNNRSGVPGVYFGTKKGQPKGFWEANLRLKDGTRISKSFSVRLFGKKNAFARAVVARNAMLADIEDRPYLSNPTAKQFAGTGRQGGRG